MKKIEELEKRWKEANQRQLESINRLLAQRQAALDILHSPQSMICNELKRSVIAALVNDPQEG